MPLSDVHVTASLSGVLTPEAALVRHAINSGQESTCIVQVATGNRVNAEIV